MRKTKVNIGTQTESDALYRNLVEIDRVDIVRCTKCKITAVLFFFELIFSILVCHAQNDFAISLSTGGCLKAEKLVAIFRGFVR